MKFLKETWDAYDLLCSGVLEMFPWVFSYVLSPFVYTILIPTLLALIPVIVVRMIKQKP